MRWIIRKRALRPNFFSINISHVFFNVYIDVFCICGGLLAQCLYMFLDKKDIVVRNVWQFVMFTREMNFYTAFRNVMVEIPLGIAEQRRKFQ